MKVKTNEKFTYLFTNVPIKIHHYNKKKKKKSTTILRERIVEYTSLQTAFTQSPPSLFPSFSFSTWKNI